MELLNASVRRVVLCTLAMIVVANPALAQDFAPVDTFFTNVGTALTSTTGRAIGLVAVCGAALLCLGGRLPVMQFVTIFLGLAILFGAGTILAGFEGGA